MVDQRDAAGTVVAVRAAQRRHEDPPGPQCRVCGREYPALAANSPASMVCVSTGLRGSGLVSRTYVVDERFLARADNAARVRRGRDVPGDTGRSSMRSSRSGAVRCRPSAVRSSRRHRRRSRSRDRSPRRRAHPSRGRSGRMRQRRRVARARPRRQRPGCGRRWDLSQAYLQMILRRDVTGCAFSRNAFTSVFGAWASQASVTSSSSSGTLISASRTNTIG